MLGDKMIAFGDSVLVSKEGDRWVHDNLASYAKMLWGRNSVQMNERLLLPDARIDRGKLRLV